MREARGRTGHSVDTCVGRVGSVWGVAQGLLAWALVEALFFTWMIITQVSALYFAGKLYLSFRYFPVLTGMVQLRYTWKRGKEKRREGRWLKEFLSSREITSPPVLTPPHTHMMLRGSRETQGRESPSQLTARGYLDIVSL